MEHAAVIRLFRAATYCWTALYAVSLLFLPPDVWKVPAAPFFAASNDVNWLAQALAHWATANAHVLIVLLLMTLSMIAVVRGTGWWLRAGVWVLYTVVMDRLWLASCGGTQLMGIMLLWNTFLFEPHSDNGPFRAFLTFLSFWAARLQLLLVYASAAAHKFTGTLWVKGQALQVVATDSAFDLHWLAGLPSVCRVLTWVMLAFMSLFPLAVWWKNSRRTWLMFGASFHLCTAIFMGIPEMGLAFIACYAIWLSDAEAGSLIARVQSLIKHDRQGSH